MTDKGENDTPSLTISVRDSGCGMSKVTVTQLFKEGKQFFQGEGDCGLGLYIAKGVVRLHEGCRIWAESEGEGKGCTVLVQLPMLPEDVEYRHPDAGLEAPDELRGSSVNTTGTRKLTQRPLSILVVDDSKLSRKTIMRMLKYGNHHCEESENGLDAFAKVRRMLIAREGADAHVTYFDAIVMDNNMPKVQ
jgi:PleD family two-component response regulator